MHRLAYLYDVAIDRVFARLSAEQVAAVLSLCASHEPGRVWAWEVNGDGRSQEPGALGFRATGAAKREAFDLFQLSKSKETTPEIRKEARDRAAFMARLTEALYTLSGFELSCLELWAEEYHRRRLVTGATDAAQYLTRGRRYKKSALLESWAQRADFIRTEGWDVYEMDAELIKISTLLRGGLESMETENKKYFPELKIIAREYGGSHRR